MTESASVETCPNCGAPLELDAAGRCRWCRAVVNLVPPPDPLSAQHPIGAPGRPMPGMPGGGLTPEQTAAAATGNGAALSLQPATARVLAAHEVAIPAGVPGVPPAGVVDLTLDVALPDGGGYTTTMRIGFSTPEKRAMVAAVGRTLPVMVNAARPDEIAIDTSRLG